MWLLTRLTECCLYNLYYVHVYIHNFSYFPFGFSSEGKIVVLIVLVPHLCLHYANMSVQYTAIFHSCKNDNFQMKIFDIFLIFAQNIDCGYTLEPPQ